MLQASSLLYAIFVCMIVSLLCGSLVMIYGYQLELKDHYMLHAQLVDAATNDFSVLVNAQGEIGKDEVSVVTNPSDDRFTTQYSVIKWGFYDLIKTQTSFKKDTVYKAALIGGVSKNNRLALYMTERDRALHIGGTAQVVGDAKISERGVKTAYIGQTQFVRSRLIEGAVGKSERELPSLQKNNTKIKSETIGQVFMLEEVAGKSLSNSFHKPTIIIKADGITNISQVSLSGNIIVTSKDSICIQPTAQLKDILIEAPSVAFASQFKGTVQVFATKSIYVQPQVSLLYPSSLYVYNETINPVAIFVGADSKVIGGIVADGNSYESSLNKMITIDTKALVVGDVYCYGKTQLKGKVVGSVYTTLFYLKTMSSIYENHLVDGVIHKMDLPSNFVGLPLFDDRYTKYAVVKEL